jgi:4-nitrophenyl phosphatase
LAPQGWRPRGFCIDVDGVLMRRPAIVPGAPEFLDALREKRIPFRIVTNNSRQRAEEAAADLSALGLPTSPAEVMTAAEAMAAHVARMLAESPGLRVFAAATPDLVTTLESRGVPVVSSRADVVCLGHDPELTYRRLGEICDEVRRCRRLIVANLDSTIPSHGGEIPGVGAIAAAVSVATGVEPFNVGKPAPTLLLLAADLIALAPSEVLMIGDRLDSDILGANRAGMPSALVLGGAHGVADIDGSGARPDFVFATLSDLWGALVD